MNLLSHQGLMMASSGSGGDPSFAFVKSLLHYESSFADVKGLSWSTGSGSPSIDTTTPIVGLGSAELSNACIYTPGSSSYQIGVNQDFCIETSVIFHSLPSSAAVCLASMYSNSTTGWALQFRNDSGPARLQISVAGDGGQNNVSWSPVINTRYDLAVARIGGTLRFFVNGSQVGSNNTNVSGSSGFATTRLTIGALYTGSFVQVINAKIDETRITIGAGRYAANYTPTFPFPDS